MSTGRKNGGGLIGFKTIKPKFKENGIEIDETIKDIMKLPFNEIKDFYQNDIK